MMPTSLEKISKLKTEHTIYPIVFGVLSFLLTISYVSGSFEQDVNYFKSFGYGQGSKDKITVVYMDDGFLNDLKTVEFLGQKFFDWPLPYKTQAALYNRILKYHPKAIFIDLAYFNQRQSDKELSYLSDGFIKNAEHAGKDGQAVPVFLAAVQSSKYGDESSTKTIHLPLEAFDGKADPVLVGWDNMSGRYPLAIEINGKAYKSAAFALYQSICESNCIINSDLANNDAEALAIQWANRNTDYLVHTSETEGVAGCVFKDQWVFIKVYNWLDKKVRSFLGLNGEEQTLCPPADTIHASMLVDPDIRQYRDYLQKMIEGRVILIGASLNGALGLLNTPTHGLQPGVYTHAMALDNLLEYGEQYPRHGVFNTHIDNIELLVFELLILLIALLFRTQKVIVHNKKNNDFNEIDNLGFSHFKDNYEAVVVKIEKETFLLTITLVILSLSIVYMFHPEISLLGMSVAATAYLAIAISITPKFTKKLTVESIHYFIKKYRHENKKINF